MTVTYDSAHRRPPLLEELTALWAYRELLAELIARGIKARYKRSVLGLAWTMLNPLLTMAILAVVFSQVFRVTVPHYPVYVLTGLLVWNFFAQSTTEAVNQLVWHGDVLRRLYVPRSIFSVAAAGAGVVNLLLAGAPLALIMALNGMPARPALLFLPVSIALLAMFALGLGLLLAALAIAFTDVVDMFQIALTAWFYLTPVIYPPEIVPGRFAWLLALNPMTYLLETFRAPLYSGALPTPTAIGLAAGCALLSLGIGSWAFARRADAIAYRV